MCTVCAAWDDKRMPSAWQGYLCFSVSTLIQAHTPHVPYQSVALEPFLGANVRQHVTHKGPFCIMQRVQHAHTSHATDFAFNE